VASESVDLVVTDPPYTMTKRGKSSRPNWMPDRMGDNVFDGPLVPVRAWMAQCYRVLKPGTHFYTFVNTNDITEYLLAARELGFRLHNVLSMIKDTSMPNRWYLKQTELVLFFRKGRAKPIHDMTSRDNVNVVMPKQRTGKLHITQKPLDFIERLVTNSSAPGDVVLDPFMGSGTTALACQRTGRRYIGFEKSCDYHARATKRLCVSTV
jgi:DNA modification methylase